jgi:predicted ABC-type transport system involved in lysophospholipase L1 biosynthesis ATPase subunit
MTSETDINLPETALTRMADRGGGPAISFQDVSKHFPAADGNRLEVLRDVSFDVRIGNVVAILGPSGSGKSTLLNMAAGLIFPDAGRVVVMGQRTDAAVDWSHVGYMFQDDRLLPWRVAVRNVALALEAGAMPAAERLRRARAVLDLVGLGGFEQSYPYQLSGGMRSRVRARAQSRRRAADPADGRAVLAARRADPQQHAPRTRSHSRHARDDDPVRHARRGGGGGSRRSRRDDVGAARSRPPHDRYFAAAAADRNAGGRRAHR